MPSMAPIRTVRGLVRGRVQGVAYRASLQREAAALALAGWVRNRPDGSVEFLLQGDSALVQRVLDWARNGPALANVTGLDAVDTTADPGLKDFKVYY
jgi:acylphosphatase